MKQIFNWLREQVMTDANLDTECPEFPCWVRTNKNCNECNLKSLQVREIFDIINEAEAKWESDCCEWHFAKGGYYKTVIASPHKEFISLKTSDLKSQPYCGHCGKPIKISEVE